MTETIVAAASVILRHAGRYLLVERARGTHPAIVLSVRRENPALHLYQRFGFFIERELDNRVGGVSYAMRLDLCD